MVVRADAVFDASFWIHACGVGVLKYVLRRYALRYTPAVARELPERSPSGREFRRMVQVGELEEAVPRRDRVGIFGRGERESISLALEHRGWVLFLDDQRPYQHAAGLGLRVVCTPLLVVALFGERTITRRDAERHLDDLSGLETVHPDFIYLAWSLLPLFGHEMGGQPQ